MKKKIMLFVEIVLVLFILFQGYQIVQRLQADRALDEKQKEITQVMEGAKDSKEPKVVDYQQKFLNLQKQYENVVALLIIPGTNIEYPIVQGTDNAYYLDHDLLHRVNVYGEIFMDYRNARDFSDENIILYGHNAEDRKEIFYDLLKYKNQDFFAQHREVLLATQKGLLHYEVYGTYVLKPDFPYRDINFGTAEGKENYLNLMAGQNLFGGKADPGYKQILTLSTCEGYENRMVVQAGLR